MRTAYVVLAGILLLNVVYQFVTAGLVVFEGGDVDSHGMGANIAHLWPLGMAIIAVIAKMGWKFVGIPVAVLILVSAQYATAESAGAVHPLIALLIAFAAYHAFVAARAPASAAA